MINFAHPQWLLLLGLLPLLAVMRGRRGPDAAVLFPSVSVSRQVGGKPRSLAGRMLAALQLLALACLILALARPQVGRGSIEVEASGIDIMLAIDVSGSMEALDFEVNQERVNRLEVVKMVVADFIKERPNDRIGLLAFAGRPYLVSPLTLDHNWLLQRLESVKIGQVEDGTAIGSAIAASTNHLRDQQAKSRLVILLTDGMNNAGKAAPLVAAEAAKALKIKVYAIGAGTQGEAPIPMQDAFGRRVLRMAKVDIDEDTLTKIGQMTGGHYYRATDTDSLQRIYAEINALETTTRKLKKYEQVDELFAFASIPGLMALLCAVALGHTLYRKLP